MINFLKTLLPVSVEFDEYFRKVYIFGWKFTGQFACTSRKQLNLVVDKKAGMSYLYIAQDSPVTMVHTSQSLGINIDIDVVTRNVVGIEFFH